MASRIGAIVDYTAARVGSEIEGIAAVFGSGSSSTDDPLRSGQTIRAAPNVPTQEFEHWSEVAALTASAWFHQDGAQQLTWRIPMRLWFTRSDLARLRQVAQPFFAPYVAAFQTDPSLGGLVFDSQILHMELGEDPPRGTGTARWGWLDVELQVVEIADP